MKINEVIELDVHQCLTFLSFEKEKIQLEAQRLRNEQSRISK